MSTLSAAVGRPDDPEGRSATVGAALDGLWTSAEGAVRERIDAIEEHVAALLLGDPKADPGEALGAAHKLAGTLGMFGLVAGTAAAREVEDILDTAHRTGVSCSPAELERMAELTNQLRRDVDGRVAQVGAVLATDDQHEPSPAATAAGAGNTVPTLARFVGRDSSLLEALRWVCTERGMDVEHVPTLTAAGPRPVAVVLIDTGSVDGPEEAVARAAGRGVPVIALLPTDDLTARVRLLAAGARVVVSADAGAERIGAALSDLDDRRRRVGSVLALGVEPDDRPDIAAAFEAATCTLRLIDDFAPLGDALMTHLPDALLLGPRLDAQRAVDVAEVVSADPVWADGRTVFVVRAFDEYTEADLPALITSADHLIPDWLGWDVIARVIADKLASRPPSAAPVHRGVAGPRARFAERLEARRVEAAQRAEPMSFLWFALAGLADINAAEGYDAGDAALGHMARVLSDQFRARELVAPWVGSSFVAGLDVDRHTANRRLRAILAELDRAGVRSTGGVASVPDDGASVDELVRVAARRARGVVARPRHHDPRPGRIVVVEDDPIVAELVSRLLEAEGYRVDLIGDGPSAAGLLCAPDVFEDVAAVLLDVTLPGLDGFAVLRAMVEANTLDRIPVVMLTARAGDEDIRAALELGAVDHVAKPFSPQVMIRRLERALSLPPRVRGVRDR